MIDRIRGLVAEQRCLERAGSRGSRERLEAVRREIVRLHEQLAYSVRRELHSAPR